jgi:hypothetical protein
MIPPQTLTVAALAPAIITHASALFHLGKGWQSSFSEVGLLLPFANTECSMEYRINNTKRHMKFECPKATSASQPPSTRRQRLGPLKEGEPCQKATVQSQHV